MTFKSTGMNNHFPKVVPMGERAILIDFEPEISEKTLKELLFLKERIEREIFKQKVEVINTYSSLLIHYPTTIEDVYSEISFIKSLLNRANIVKNKSVDLYHVPVSYDPEFGLDLELISAEKGLSIEEIISLHTAAVYTVYFIGFLPGFLYLGGLDERLYIPRKVEPRMKVAKGAVGIGGTHTGIYPKTSPGGWQLLGQTPLSLFAPHSNPPCEISPGDKVRFYAVSNTEFLSIAQEVEKGTYKFKKEVYGS